MVVGGLLVLAALFIVQLTIRTNVGLGYSGADDDGMLMDFDCGSKIEWVIGGGPSVPSTSSGMDTHDVRTLCHEKYDDDVGGWRALFFGGVAGGVIGMIIAAVGEKMRRAAAT